MQCRACMKTDCDGFLDMSIGVAMDNKNLYDYFNECTQLQATTVDKLPKTLCIACTRNLQIAYNFRHGARQADEELKKILISQKASPEMILYDPSEQFQTLEDMELADDPLAVLDSDEQELEENEMSPTANDSDLATVYGMTEEEYQIDPPTEQIIRESPEVFVVQEESEYDSMQDIGTELIIPAEEQLEENIELLCEKSNEDSFFTIISDESEKPQTIRDGEEFGVFTGQKQKRTYFCESCDCAYSLKNELKKHVFEEHKNEIICLECPKIYNLPSDLRLHKKLVHETESPVHCPCCKEPILLQRKELIKHFRANHSTRYEKYFPALRASANITGNSTPYRCKMCKNHFSSVLELAEHIQHHKFECSLCFKSFTNIGTYYSHVKRLHNCSANSLPATSNVVQWLGPSQIDEETRYECPVCKRSYRNLGSFNTHMREKHKQPSDSAATTTTTGAKTTNLMEIENITENGEVMECSLRQNEVNITIVKPRVKPPKPQPNKKRKYLCSFCPRVLSTAASLQSHESVAHLHKSPKLEQCQFCQKKMRAGYVNRHIETVHFAERRFVCDICSNSFKSTIQLRGHQLLHKKRNFQCAVCHKRYVRRYDLRIHMRTHTGELPYACHLCDRRFMLKVRLSYHLQKHANIKHKCKVCDKEFINVTTLRVHAYTHTGMPYRCDICKYACVKRDVFTRHMIRVHDVTMTGDELFAMFKKNTGRSPYVKSAEELEIEANNFDQDESTS